MSVNNLIKPTSQEPPQWSKLNVKSVNADVITANSITTSDSNATLIQGIPVSAVAPADGEILSYNLGANELEYMPMGNPTSQTGTESGITQDSNPKTTAVSFSTPFSTVPKVVITSNDITDITAGLSLSTSNITTNGFNIESFVENVIPNIEATLFTGADIFKTSLKIVNGNPAVAFHSTDVGTEKIYYVRASDTLGAGWGTPIVVASDGTRPSLEVVNGLPAIGYRVASKLILNYVRASDINGSGWGVPVVVSSGVANDNSTLKIVNGNPAMAFKAQSTPRALAYARASDINGNTWGTTILVDSDVADSVSMTVVNGNPAIGYGKADTNSSNYIRASDINGSIWGTSVEVGPRTSTNDTTDLAVVNGNPAMTFVNTSTKFSRASDINGSIWGAPIDITTDEAYDTSLAVINGKPAVAFYNYTVGGLYYGSATDANGSIWDTPALYSSDASSGCSLVDLNSKPAISNGYTKVGFNLLGTSINFNVDYIADE